MLNKITVSAWSAKRYSLLRSIIIGIISILVLLLSFKGHVIYYWDQGFIPYGTSNQLARIVNLWIPQYGLGVLGGSFNPLEVFYELQYITSLLLPAWLSEFVTIWIFYYLGGLGTTIFIEQILKFNEIKSIAKRVSIIIPSILFYYGVPWWWFWGGLFNPIQWPDIVAEGLMPFLFLFTYKFFDKISQGRVDFKTIFAIYIVFILLIYNFNVWNLILLLVYFPYLIYLFITKINSLKNLIISLIIAVFIGLSIYLASKPFIFLTNLLAENFVGINTQLIIGSLESYKGSSLPIFSLLISPSLSTVFKEIIREPIFLFNYYRNILYLIISTIIFVLLFLPILKRKHSIFNDYLTFLVILILVVINLWMGKYSPLFPVIKYIFIHVPVFIIIRTTWVAFDFVMPFILTILYSSSIYLIINLIKDPARVRLAVMLLSLLSISYGFPVLAGYATSIHLPNGPSPYLNDISPYTYIANTINSDDNLTTVVVLPPASTLYTTKEYLGLDIYYWLLNNKNIIDGGYLRSPGSISLYYSFYMALLDNNSILANNILSILNVKYLILEGDALNIPGGIMPPFNISQIRSHITYLNMSFITNYSDIILYEYNNPVGLFYSPKTFIIGNLSSITAYLSNNSYNPKISIIITPVNDLYNISISQLSILEETGKDIHQAKILHVMQYSPEDFCVIINSTGPFLLVFTQTFSPYWSAYVNGSEIPQGYHFIAYGFANVWYVNGSGVLGIRIMIPAQYTVQIDYIKYFGLSLFLLTLLYICLIVVKKIKNNEFKP